MKQVIKKIARIIIPEKGRYILWNIIPKIYILNTYLLKRFEPVFDLYPIDPKFLIRIIDLADIEQLKKAHEIRGPKSYRRIPPRLNAPEWHGLAVFDTLTGDIAYIAWVIDRSIPYFDEFGIKMKQGQFLLKDGFCKPDYRHQGLHTRMEQERINWSIRHGASEIFIQIHNSNPKGIKSVIDNGYVFYKQNRVISWPLFEVYRELFSFIKNPFKKVIK